MVRLKHPVSGFIKEVPTGFSWTTFFFGFFVPVFRGCISLAFIYLILGFCTLSISWLVAPFIINKQCIRCFLKEGFCPVTEVDEQILMGMGISFESQRKMAA